MLAINSVTSSGATVFTSHTRSGYSSGQPFGPSHTQHRRTDSGSLNGAYCVLHVHGGGLVEGDLHGMRWFQWFRRCGTCCLLWERGERERERAREREREGGRERGGEREGEGERRGRERERGGGRERERERGGVEREGEGEREEGREGKK